MRRIAIYLADDAKLTRLAQEQPDAFADLARSLAEQDFSPGALAGVLVDLMEVLAARGVEIESAWGHEIVDVLNGEPLVYAFTTENVDAWSRAVAGLRADPAGLFAALKSLDANASEGTPSRGAMLDSFVEVIERLSAGLASVTSGKVLAVVVP